MSSRTIGRQSQPDLSRGEVFEVLRNRRRRYVLHYLKRFSGPVQLRELATQIAAWEHGQETNQVSKAERRRVYTTLQQTHLEKMADAEIIDYDADEGVIASTPHTDDLTVYLEVVGDREFPWREYYLSLGAISSALVVALWANVPPLTALPDLMWASLITLVLTLSAVYHTYTGEAMKLEHHDEPPEVPDDG